MVTDTRYSPNPMQVAASDDSQLVLTMPFVKTGEWLIPTTMELETQLRLSPVSEFDPRVAREIILYIASRLENASFQKISKLLYFSDKLHLARYGRLISGDRYIATEHGPVPNNVYDMLKAAKTANGNLSFGFSVRDGRVVEPHRLADLDWISDSERECLDDALAQYGPLSFRELTEVSHDSAWQSTERNREIALEAIVASIDNPSDLLEHLQNPNP